VIPVDMVVGAPMAAALGFAYGMGPCLVSCAPFLGPVFLASDGGIKKSWQIILPLSLGRLTAYSTFGLIVGAAGHYVKGSITSDSVRIVVGCAVVMMGLALLLRKSERVCPSSPSQAAPLQRMEKSTCSRALLPGGLFLMGIGMALSPCAPLGLVLFSASMAGSAAEGMLLGMSFGLGAIVIPAIVYGVGMAYLGTQLREQLQNWRPKIERISALLLVAVGISNLARW
jgi:thiol:disulfide interchange protein DsbD